MQATHEEIGTLCFPPLSINGAAAIIVELLPPRFCDVGMRRGRTSPCLTIEDLPKGNFQLDLPGDADVLEENPINYLRIRKCSASGNRESETEQEDQIR